MRTAPFLVPRQLLDALAKWLIFLALFMLCFWMSAMTSSVTSFFPTLKPKLRDSGGGEPSFVVESVTRLSCRYGCKWRFV